MSGGGCCVAVFTVLAVGFATLWGSVAMSVRFGGDSAQAAWARRLGFFLSAVDLANALGVAHGLLLEVETSYWRDMIVVRGDGHARGATTFERVAGPVLDLALFELFLLVSLFFVWRAIGRAAPRITGELRDEVAATRQVIRAILSSHAVTALGLFPFLHLFDLAFDAVDLVLGSWAPPGLAAAYTLELGLWWWLLRSGVPAVPSRGARALAEASERSRETGGGP